MRVSQYFEPPTQAPHPAHLVLAFGDADHYQRHHAQLRELFPDALICGCSTAGQIAAEQVDDFPLVITAIELRHSHHQSALKVLDERQDNPLSLGQELARQLPPDGLRHVLLFASGLQLNASAVVQGMQQVLPSGISITGGLAGDGPRFRRCWLFCNEAAHTDALLAIGLYGDRLQVGFGSQGGWDSFGPERLITKSEGNVLHSLDDRPALELYKHYLGDEARGLPASALKFPLSLRNQNGQSAVVRTILGIDESNGSMTFAGDMPEGSYARLMRANFDRLVDGAAQAAEHSRARLSDQQGELALLISCVGRRMVLGQAVEEEVEAVRQSLGPEPTLCGFYSYGEISPLQNSLQCGLHNQTMTITVLSES